jgi:hypothetical protein
MLIEPPWPYNRSTISSQLPGALKRHVSVGKAPYLSCYPAIHIDASNSRLFLYRVSPARITAGSN